jgi:glutathione S-transferase
VAPYPPLRLYRIPFSTNVERVALALAHKQLAKSGIEVEYVEIDPDDRSEVVRVSGQELVPVLVDGDRVVADSPAILEYLEERFPERPLFPADPARRAELRVFIDWFNQLWKRPPNLIFDEEQKPEPDRARIAELESRIADALTVFEDLLAGRDYLFGDELTVADVTAFPFLKYSVIWDEGDEHRFHEILRDAQRLDGRFPRLEAWIYRMNVLPRA